MKKAELRRQQKKLQQILRRIRIEAGLRQVELAESLGKHQSFVSKYESGERTLDLLEIREICAAVGVSLHELIERLEKALTQVADDSPSAD